MTNNNQEHDDHHSITDHEITSKRHHSNNNNPQDHQDLDLSRKKLHTTTDDHHRREHEVEDPEGVFDDDDEDADGGDDNGFDLTLSLSFRSSTPKPTFKPSKTPSPPPPPPSQNFIYQNIPPPHPIMMMAADPSSFYTITSPPLNPFPTSAPSRAPRAPRRSPNQAPRGDGKSDTVPPPFPWATDRRAAVHSLKHLLGSGIAAVTGLVQCKRCEKQYEMEFDLEQKFLEVGLFIQGNKNSMHHRAPPCWMAPVLPTCLYCEQENSAKPVLADKKKEINWLFLLLGQMVGVCTLNQLKYFCKHTKNHRTGAKDRVLYLTYLGLCKQLDPTGPFDC